MLGGDVVTVRSPALVTELKSDAAPGWAVSCTSSGYRVGKLVEENLVDVVVLGHFRQIP